jgi:TolB-like protein
VIASGTAFTYKDKLNDPRQIGRELNVRYALQGSVRRAGPSVQVNAQLIDTESATNLWAKLWSHPNFSMSRKGGDVVEIPRALLHRLTDTLCYAA